MKAYYGIKSGMTFLEYIAFVFDLNSQIKTKLSDEQIIIKIIKEFPYREELLDKLTVKRLHKYRADYNSGYLRKNIPAPKIPSFRYVKGVAITRHGTPISNELIKKRLATQLKRWKKDHVRTLKAEITKKPPRTKKKKKLLRRDTKNKLIRIGTRKAHKAFQKRLWLQKQAARLRGVSPWD